MALTIPNFSREYTNKHNEYLYTSLRFLQSHVQYPYQWNQWRIKTNVEWMI